MRLLGMTLCLTLSCFASAQNKVYENDLGIMFPLQSEARITLSKSANATQIFKGSWLDTVSKSFNETSVGDAIDQENRSEDWSLISLRLVPCSPLGTYPHQDIDTFCWPELRQVWQPVLKNFRSRWNTILPYYADDRAIHALYDVGLDSEEDRILVSRVKEQLSRYNGHLEISSETKKLFVKKRNLAVKQYIEAILNLRDSQIDIEEFKGINYRPETFDEEMEKNFIKRLRKLLIKFAPSKNIKALTAFSLPSGRTPANTDEWIFLSFEGRNGELVQLDIDVKLNSPEQETVVIGKSEFASMRRDDPSLYDLWESDPEGLGQLMRENILMFDDDYSRLASKIADRRKTLVPNTTCGSCHKFNRPRFDFHNYSYLEDNVPSVSMRTRTDIRLDLEWLDRWTSNKS